MNEHRVEARAHSLKTFLVIGLLQGEPSEAVTDRLLVARMDLILFPRIS